jgi:hypothetical protein
MDGKTAAEHLEAGDRRMREGNPAQALAEYRAAWPLTRGTMEPVQRVWVLLSLANAAVRAGDFDEAFAALSGLQNGFAQTKVVAGNPLFHLLVGLTYVGLRETPDRYSDAFARALVCGGPEIFAGEDPQHVDAMKRILKPPAELGTWDGYTGCSRDLLNGATGFLAEVLAERLGAPPPYRYPDPA